MTDREMYYLLTGEGMTPEGACGLMGNIKGECGMNPENLQNSGNKKLDMTDEEYTAAVDSGEYTNFVRDSLGYGYAQWTYWSRKEGLLRKAKEYGCSIGDPTVQLEYMLQELAGYKEVMAILKTARTVKEASDIVLMKYERPAAVCNYEKNKSAENEAALNEAKAAREQYGNEFLALFSGDRKEEEISMTESQARQKIVNIAVAWYGRKESDGSHRVIIDTYNGHEPLARGYKVKYTDSWCATYVSAVAISAGWTDIIPTECGCGQMIQLFQSKGRWIENDAYVPKAGDVIFYDWDDSGVGDNTGWPDHVGYVVSVSGNAIRVIEGNCGNAVAYRDLQVNRQYIRGYGVPDYGKKANQAESQGGTSGSTGSTGTGSGSGTGSGRSMCMTPQWVGEVTADVLNVRSWAGTEYPNIESWPKLAKGNRVEVCDSVNDKGGETWYYVRINGRIFGFVYSDYIMRIVGGNSGSSRIKVGNTVQYAGSTHYTSSYKSAAGKRCRPGRAKVTAINPEGAHPYHLVAVPGGGSTVYGWTDAGDVKS